MSKLKNSKLESFLKSWKDGEEHSVEDILSALYDGIEDQVDLIVPVIPTTISQKLEDLKEGLNEDPNLSIEIKCLEDEDGIWFMGYTSEESAQKDGHTDTIELPIEGVLETAYWVEESKGVSLHGEDGYLSIPRDLLEGMLDALGIVHIGDRELQKGADTYREGDFSTARAYYEKSAEKGNMTALSNLGYVYYYGRDVEVDKERARFLWEEAAKGGDVCATYKLGDMYRNGDLPQNESLSKELFLKAYGLSKVDKDINCYPDVVLRILKYMPETFKKEELISLGEEALQGFKERIEHGDQFSGQLVENLESLLEDLRK